MRIGLLCSAFAALLLFAACAAAPQAERPAATGGGAPPPPAQLAASNTPPAEPLGSSAGGQRAVQDERDDTAPSTVEKRESKSTPIGLAAPASPEAPRHNAPLRAPGDAALGDRSTCPVTGTEFVVGAQSPKFEYQGKIYYFCSLACLDKFKADPKKYLRH